MNSIILHFLYCNMVARLYLYFIVEHVKLCRRPEMSQIVLFVQMHRLLWT